MTTLDLQERIGENVRCVFWSLRRSADERIV